MPDRANEHGGIGRIPLTITATASGQATDGVLVAVMVADLDALELALAELVDALSDEMSMEVSRTPEVQAKVRAAVTLLYGRSGDYADAWWLA